MKAIEPSPRWLKDHGYADLVRAMRHESRSLRPYQADRRLKT